MNECLRMVKATIVQLKDMINWIYDEIRNITYWINYVGHIQCLKIKFFLVHIIMQFSFCYNIFKSVLTLSIRWLNFVSCIQKMLLHQNFILAQFCFRDSIIGTHKRFLSIRNNYHIALCSRNQIVKHLISLNELWFNARNWK